MPKFPAVTYRQLVKVAKKLDFYFYREAKGSHEIWRRDSDERQTTIPNHGKKIIKRRTLKSILDDLGISVNDFVRMK